MTIVSRRGAILGASAVVGLGRKARAATPVRLGILTDMSGPYSEDAGPGSVVAAELAIEDFAKLHPELKVELLTADAGTKTDTYVSLAGSWYDRDGVDAIFDIPFSAGALALRTVAEQRNKVLMLTGPATSDLTGKACGPNHVHWVYDSWSFASSTARAMVQRGGDTWFFIQADYAMGASLTGDARAMVEKLGGKVLGVAKHPFPGTTDFSSFLVQAQASGAKVLGLTNAGADAGNTIKQAAEFGLTSHGMKIAATLFHIPQVHAIGLQAAKGLVLTDCYYWDRNDESRAFARRFAPKMKGFMPASTQAGVYSAVIHYLKTAVDMGPDAVKADGRATIARMKQIPTDDPIFGKGRIRQDGRKIHDMFLFEVKDQSESKYPWDYYRQLADTPAEQAFRPESEGGCALVKS
ncbi:MAG TPA: ABC transporter permease [Acetobacteraceae bacterium]|jgi:branched-chain amino acid transport system substrate-binding protein|nr:ABC transporter permease [Acetobacteraceae bacterium]